MSDLHLFTDGACLGNPGPGGWAAILRFGDHEKEFSGGCAHTTNNRMEMTAVIEGLKALNRPVSVRITTDSQYVIKGMTEWMAGWIRRGWKNSQNKPVENQDLWQALLEVSKPHKLSWQWVRGHAGHPENERCDQLARSRAIEAQQSGSPTA